MKNKFVLALCLFLLISARGINDLSSLRQTDLTAMVPLLTGNPIENLELSVIADEQNSKSIEKFLDVILAHPSFIDHNYRLLRFELLQGASDDDLFTILMDMDQVRLFQEESREFGEFEFNRLLKIHNIPNDYKANLIDLSDVQSRLLDNFMYDQLNMGVDNFLYSSFQYLLGRKPTRSEFDEAKKMCEDQQANLFFQAGRSKADYLNILTSNDNYFEFQVSYWYERLFFNKPDISTVNQIMLRCNDTADGNTVENIIKQAVIYKFDS